MDMKRNIILASLALVISADAAAQRISARNEVIDCGAVGYEIPVTVRFELRNKGNDMTVTNVRTACGCITAEYPRGNVARGDSFYVAATYDARQLGHFEKEVAVYTTASDSPFYLKMRGVVVAEAAENAADYKFTVGSLQVDKNDIEFDDVNRGDNPVQRIYFRNAGDKAVTPVLMHLPRYLSATVSPTTVQPGRTGVATITLDTDKLRGFGLTRSSVYIGMYPGDKVSADKEITVSAVLLPGFDNMSETQKLAAPVIQLSGSTLDLGEFGDKASKSGVILIENVGKSILDIRSMQMFTDGLKVSLNKTKLRPGDTAKLKITAYKKLLKTARSKPRVLMITNDPDRPKVVVDIDVK